MTTISLWRAIRCIGVKGALACSLAAIVVPAAFGQTPSKTSSIPAPYLTTRDQAGHSLVKTEQFVVPIGTVVAVTGLAFGASDCRFTELQGRILRQVFNSLEEITENTVNDSDQKRVAEFKQMKFEIRGFSNLAQNDKEDRAIALNCATAVKASLTTDGTPAWRLEPKGFATKPFTEPRARVMTIDFRRVK